VQNDFMIPSVSLTDVFQAWLARAGDADLSSIVNTVLYGMAVLAALRRWRKLCNFRAPRAERHFWLILLLVLLALGLNKQLDFQVLLIEIARPIAMQGGWYSSRRLVQAVFALLLTGMAGGLAVYVMILIRKHWAENKLSLSGFVILLIYFVIEATSLNHLEEGLEAYKKWGVRLSDLIEMAGIILILVNAVRFEKKRVNAGRISI